MPFKLVAISDLHFDVSTAGVPRFEEVRAALDRSVACAIDRKVDAWCFLGDCFDPDSGSVVYRALEAMMTAVMKLHARGISTVLVSGNHDVCNVNDDTVLAPIAGLGLTDVHVLERPTSFSIYDLQVVALPHMIPTSPYDPNAFLLSNVPKDNPSIVLSHLTIPTALPGSESAELARGKEATFPEAALAQIRSEDRPLKLVLSGHHHKRQVTKEGIHIVGSAIPMRFDEERNDPGFLYIEIPT
jgi:DNA repair exonuclease SbcCD nuclease subunit